MPVLALPYGSVIDVPTMRILGRDEATTGPAEALTAAEARALLSVYTSAQVDSLLSGKANTSHTHTPADITGFGEAVDDEVATLLTAGTGISLSYNDNANTLTIASTVSAGVGGSTGSTDNRILRADGTGGATLQSSLVSIDDSGQIQFHGSHTVFNVQLRNPDWGSQHGILLSSLGTVFVANGSYLWRIEAGFGHLLGVATAQIQFTADCRLQRGDAAGILRQFSGTTAQKYEVYNTYTSDTSYERLNIAWASNVCTIEVTAGSAGGTLRGLRIGGASTSLLGFYGATPVDRPDTIADPTGGGTIDAEARTAINTIIDRLQELGLIA